MCTRTRGGAALACIVALAIGLLPPASAAAPAGGPGESAAGSGEKAERGKGKESSKLPKGSDRGSVDAALEEGDLTSARDRAVAAREADPSPENWLREARVLEKTGDLSGAIAAYQAHLAALPKGASKKDRARVGETIRELKERARGAVEDEPESSHRDALDGERAKRLAAARPEPEPKPLPPAEPKDEKITRKWYFWVTLAAIVASGAAITAIAIKAALEDQPDALDAQHAPAPGGPALFRF